ncbi:ORF1 [White sturgeon adenovirus 1]|uniref:ORF1 n=1 Tax=White sturgeon adenovirus 1 TaxID=2580388 RepID=A0A4P8PQV5_9ADEN|nr:ORF1 [White sturgeon adenovirus 1]QCQ84165.1 ORF1 [White sturgeon adenovirus 1]
MMSDELAMDLSYQNTTNFQPTTLSFSELLTSDGWLDAIPQISWDMGTAEQGCPAAACYPTQDYHGGGHPNVILPTPTANTSQAAAPHSWDLYSGKEERSAASFSPTEGRKNNYTTRGDLGTSLCSQPISSLPVEGNHNAMAGARVFEMLDKKRAVIPALGGAHYQRWMLPAEHAVYVIPTDLTLCSLNYRQNYPHKDVGTMDNNLSHLHVPVSNHHLGFVTKSTADGLEILVQCLCSQPLSRHCKLQIDNFCDYKLRHVRLSVMPHVELTPCKFLIRISPKMSPYNSSVMSWRFYNQMCAMKTRYAGPPIRFEMMTNTQTLMSAMATCQVNHCQTNKNTCSETCLRYIQMITCKFAPDHDVRFDVIC